MRFLQSCLLFLALHAVVLPVVAQEFLYPALIRANPNELAYFSYIGDDCPLTDQEAKDVIEGVFIRSRIKPLVGYAWLDDDLYLSISLECLLLDNNNPVFSIDVNYGNATIDPSVLYDFDFGSLGIGAKDFIRDGLKTNVENAITVFIKANFDL